MVQLWIYLRVTNLSFKMIETLENKRIIPTKQKGIITKFKEENHICQKLNHHIQLKKCMIL